MPKNPVCEIHNVEVVIRSRQPVRMPHCENDEERAHFSGPIRTYECPIPGCTWMPDGGGPPPA